MKNITFHAVPATDPVLRALIAALDEELISRYQGGEIFTVDLDSPSASRIAFLLVLCGETAVGCGALRPIDGETAELKRIFVKKHYRGRGIGTRLVETLEKLAAERGFSKIRLETGTEQPEAIALYKKAGYREIEAYGEYIGCERSICFEKEAG